MPLFYLSVKTQPNVLQTQEEIPMHDTPEEAETRQVDSRDFIDNVLQCLDELQAD